MNAPEDRLDEIVRLLALQLRRSATSQAALAQELARAGFKAPRIAELLGTTPGTVHKDLQRGQKTARASAKRTPKPVNPR